jgi:hypothetical protein
MIHRWPMTLYECNEAHGVNLLCIFQKLKEHNMQDPKQLYLFNDMNYDDMESDDYEESYFNYLMDHLDETEDEQEF